MQFYLFVCKWCILWIKNWSHIATYFILVVILVLVGQPFFKSLRLRCFKSDRDKSWHDCCLRTCVSIDGVRFLIWVWRHAFKICICIYSIQRTINCHRQLTDVDSWLADSRWITDPDLPLVAMDCGCGQPVPVPLVHLYCFIYKIECGLPSPICYRVMSMFPFVNSMLAYSRSLKVTA